MFLLERNRKAVCSSRVRAVECRTMCSCQIDKDVEGDNGNFLFSEEWNKETISSHSSALIAFVF